ncbi:MAG: mercury resistance system transport protein MerF [Magnetovibrio sp.]|nr:mercury resistance system transport protein MerF [Magnetovibrio sp.]
MTAGVEEKPGGADKRTVKVGAVGAAIMAICCFTPFLVVVLGAAGLSAWLGWLDYVLLPGLALFICILGYGLWRLKSN